MSQRIRQSQVGPGSLRGGSTAGRMRRRGDGFATDVRRASIAKRVVLTVVVAIVVVAVACAAAWFAFTASVSGKLSLGDSGAATALVSAEEGSAYYALLAADLDEGASTFEPDAILLARVDPSSRVVTLVSVPADLRVRLSDGERHRLSEAPSVGGEAELISTVASFADVSISHYARTDAAGISGIVDRLGGVTVTVSEDVDDPTAGSIFIPSGEQSLSGEQALVFLRASNYSEGAQTQMANQRAFAASLAQRLFEADGLAALMQLDGVAGFLSTDLDAGGALSVASSLRGMIASDVFLACVPGYSSGSGDEAYYIADSDSWTSMMELVDAGEDPSVDEEEQAAESVDRGSFEITVRNGSGITGGATEIADSLTAAGFQVAETGNADSYVYDETLVIYQDDAYETAATAVVDALGMGRAISSSGFYTFDTEILVVLGKDWMPTE